MMDWPKLMGLGLGVLRLAPDAFWSMTPRELTAALRGARERPMEATDLDALIARYPDRKETP